MDLSSGIFEGRPNKSPEGLLTLGRRRQESPETEKNVGKGKKKHSCKLEFGAERAS